MKVLLFFIFAVTIRLSSSIFATPSTCRSDRDCPRLFSSRSGKCVQQTNVFCGIGNIFKRNKQNCDYRTCASCLNDVDCTGYDRYCQRGAYICRQRQTTPRPFNNPFPNDPNNYVYNAWING